jgi:hypothetical protein
MGRGRNKRRQNRQRRNREKGKDANQCECGRRGNSNHTCRLSPESVEDREKRRLEKRKARADKREQKRNQEVMSGRYSKSSSPDFIGIGTSYRTLFENDASQLLGKARGWIENGNVTDLTILAPGVWNRSARRHLFGKLERDGAAWAANHVVFQLRDESLAEFIVRAIGVYEITHFFDAGSPIGDDSILEVIATSPELTKIKLYHYKEETAGHIGLLGWLRKTTSPQYLKPLTRHQDAYVVIDIPVLDEITA